MNDLAKRVHTIAPRDVELTFEDGSRVRLSMRSAEFFQEAFQAEGTDGAGTTHRLVTDGAGDPLIAGRETDDGWETVGAVAAVEPAD